MGAYKAYLRQAAIAKHRGDVKKFALLAKRALTTEPEYQEANFSWRSCRCGEYDSGGVNRAGVGPICIGRIKRRISRTTAPGSIPGASTSLTSVEASDFRCDRASSASERARERSAGRVARTRSRERDPRANDGADDAAQVVQFVAGPDLQAPLAQSASHSLPLTRARGGNYGSPPKRYCQAVPMVLKSLPVRVDTPVLA
jgi:hypothetical protein